MGHACMANPRGHVWATILRGVACSEKILGGCVHDQSERHVCAETTLGVCIASILKGENSGDTRSGTTLEACKTPSVLKYKILV